MTEHQSSRTLVKSAPELWAECSDPASLARHLGAFGEIRITRLEPETTVAWEGAAACGTVELAPAGWGTRVTLTVTARDGRLPDAPVTEAEAEPEPQLDPQHPPDSHSPPGSQLRPEAEPATEAPATQRTRGLARLFARWRAPAESSEAAVVESPAAPPEPAVVEPPAAPPEPAVVKLAAPQEPEPAQPAEHEMSGNAPEESLLTAALDSLGRAHHRPYSRA